MYCIKAEHDSQKAAKSAIFLYPSCLPYNLYISGRPLKSSEHFILQFSSVCRGRTRSAYFVVLLIGHNKIIKCYTLIPSQEKSNLKYRGQYIIQCSTQEYARDI